MNYILEPKVGAALTNFVNYGSPNKAAEPFINKDILDNPLIYPPADVLAKLPFQKDIGEDELEVLRPLDRGQDGLSATEVEHRRRPAAAGAQPSGEAARLGSRATCCCCRRACGSSFLLVIPTLLIIAYSLGQRGVIDPIQLHVGQPRLVELPHRAEPASSCRSSSRSIVVRARRRRSRACCSASRSRTGSRASAGASATCTSCS